MILSAKPIDDVDREKQLPIYIITAEALVNCGGRKFGGVVNNFPQNG